MSMNTKNVYELLNLLSGRTDLQNEWITHARRPTLVVCISHNALLQAEGEVLSRESQLVHPASWSCFSNFFHYFDILIRKWPTVHRAGFVHRLSCERDCWKNTSSALKWVFKLLGRVARVLFIVSAEIRCRNMHALQYFTFITLRSGCNFLGMHVFKATIEYFMFVFLSNSVLRTKERRLCNKTEHLMQELHACL